MDEPRGLGRHRASVSAALLALVHYKRGKQTVHAQIVRNCARRQGVVDAGEQPLSATLLSVRKWPVAAVREWQLFHAVERKTRNGLGVTMRVSASTLRTCRVGGGKQALYGRP